MAMTAEEAVSTLQAHRANLLTAKTWEEYRDAHLMYVQMLLEFYQVDEKANIKRVDLICNFIGFAPNKA